MAEWGPGICLLELGEQQNDNINQSDAAKMQWEHSKASNTTWEMLFSDPQKESYLLQFDFYMPLTP